MAGREARAPADGRAPAHPGQAAGVGERARVQAQPGDLEVGVVRASVDADPATGAGGQRTREQRRAQGRGQQAGADQGVADGARAVVARVGDLAVAAAPLVRLGDDLVGAAISARTRSGTSRGTAAVPSERSAAWAPGTDAAAPEAAGGAAEACAGGSAGVTPPAAAEPPSRTQAQAARRATRRTRVRAVAAASRLCIGAQTIRRPGRCRVARAARARRAVSGGTRPRLHRGPLRHLSGR
jgi:hypothetical protein